MTVCRVCGGKIAEPAYEAPAPALTSIMTLLDIHTRVYVCNGCGHAQCDEIPDIETFYDTGYRISLGSEGQDQIFAVKPDGTVIYRTDHQAEIARNLLNLPERAKLLDYGAAKADTLRKIVAKRPDIEPHVFDISRDYASAWNGWIAPDAQAAYEVPAAWDGRFDAVMSHFVIEHVADPVGFVRRIHKLLKPRGTLLLSMPDASANPGDMTVADHVNHFSEASLRRALAAGGFEMSVIDTTSFPGAFFAVAVRSETPVRQEQDAALVQQAVERGLEICDFWRASAACLEKQADTFRGRKAAIYGAGFYGSWIFSRVGKDVELTAFLDQNPNLQNAMHFGHPVIAPTAIADDAEALFIGLNPLKARAAIGNMPYLQKPGLELIWLEA
ncbi:class I SAM-dependent methyltransferase [Rhizobium sophorae]|uniref:Class I SAM-dependent methyltransferase n=1 Tax=Rhizobium sophorae TaxID=1535242 RepID=A0A7Y3SBE8_9HYPH|nr:class I SAM-dependent methyltransferase [Rhizobium sophorae]MBX4862980.1 class I SAM-dependent methyltransferase [Rhizobium bangladeshense]NNU40521.1 class I SAM-dependent methyltransferase [Rhizobium sophorae]